MAKETREKFESLDYLRKNEAFAEYRSYWDEFDPKIKDVNLKKFVCELPITKQQRRNLLKVINTSLV